MFFNSKNKLRVLIHFFLLCVLVELLLGFGYLLKLVFSPGVKLHTIEHALPLSRILESDKLDITKEFAQQPCDLVIFDIDNTLAQPETSVGTDQWFSYMMKAQVDERGISSSEALRYVLPLYFFLQKHIVLSLAEQGILSLLGWFSSHGIPVVLLTARSDLLKKITLKQLRTMGLKLPFKGLDGYEFTRTFKVPARLSDGVIFCGSNDKGAVLFYMLEQSNFKPKKIIFVDDKLHNVTSVERACLERNVEFVGIRYSKLDDTVKNFNPLVAEKELKDLTGLTVEQALKKAFSECKGIY